MKNRRILLTAAAALAVLIIAGCSGKQPAPPAEPAEQAAIMQPFLGRWDLTINSPKATFPSWLELYQTNGVLKANMVGRTGNVQPVPRITLNQGTLDFTAPSQEEFQAKLVDGNLTGTTTSPNETPWTWTGVRAPSLARTGTPEWGKPIKLFNGRNLKGWHEVFVVNSPNNHHWKVEHGTLVSPGQGPELVSDAKFEDFKLHVQFNLGPNSNSGVYLRGRYEVQTANNSANESAVHHNGAIYGFFAPTPEQPRVTGKWQTYDITLVGRQVTVVQNGVTVIDNKEIPGITGGALNSNEGEPGPIYLQGSEEGHVAFRDIVITPAKE